MDLYEIVAEGVTTIGRLGLLFYCRSLKESGA